MNQSRYATLIGPPIRIYARSDLRAFQGKIGEHKGTPVHAASFIRKRQIVLDTALLSNTTELRRIVLHELFHFVWVRLSNSVRRSFERMVAAQFQAPGELGWSAEYRKKELTATDVLRRTRLWREYCCEAFCDTAAYIHGRVGEHDEITLPKRYRARRIHWFGNNLGAGRIRI